MPPGILHVVVVVDNTLFLRLRAHLVKHYRCSALAHFACMVAHTSSHTSLPKQALSHVSSSNSLQARRNDLMRNFASASNSPVFASRWASPILLFAAIFASQKSAAQSLGYEGPTGVFVTPLAYTSASPANGLGKPAVSYHFLAAGNVVGDFSTVSITEGFAKRFEFGYTSEIHAAGRQPASYPAVERRPQHRSRQGRHFAGELRQVPLGSGHLSGRNLPL